MTMKIDMPRRNDARWDDALWRTEKLRKIKHDSGLNLRELAELAGIPYHSIRHYHSGRWQQISTNELRLMIYELTAG